MPKKIQAINRFKTTRLPTDNLAHINIWKGAYQKQHCGTILDNFQIHPDIIYAPGKYETK